MSSYGTTGTKHRNHSVPPMRTRSGTRASIEARSGSTAGQRKRRRRKVVPLPLFDAWPPAALRLPDNETLNRLSRAEAVRDAVQAQGVAVSLASEMTDPPKATGPSQR